MRSYSVLAVLGSSLLTGATASAVEGCSLLAIKYPELTFGSMTAQYATESQDYYSQSCRLTPRCVFTPQSAAQVAAAVSIINATSSDFSVRSGGHSTSVGFANTDTGILIALDNFNQTVVSSDRKVASIGPGQSWQRVFDALTPQGLSLVGGRLGPVGVGGLLIGGGLGYQSNEFGLACDNVINFEVVTGDGVVRNANATANTDIYWALKGGSSGFGIVTRFDIMAHELGTIYAGTATYNESEIPKLLSLYNDYTASEPDPKSHLIFPVIEAQSVGRIVIMAFYYSLAQAKPPARFQPFFDVPHFNNTVKNTNMSAWAFEQGETDAGTVRALFRAVSYKRSAAMDAASLQIWEDAMTPLRSIEGFLFIHAFQPISRGMQTPRNGGNALGLDPSDGLLQWIALTVRWSDPKDDALVLAAMQNCTDHIQAAAAQMQRSARIIYMNDASGDQPVYQSYGEENFRRLQSIQKAHFNNFRVFNQLQNKHFEL